MLMHEWIKFRDAQVKRAEDGGGAPEADEKAEAEVQAEEQEPVEEAVVAAPEADEQAAAEVQAEEQEPVEEAVVAAPQDAGVDAESTSREKEALLESLHQEMLKTERSVRGRLEALQGRQKQLPIDVAEMPAPSPGDGPKGATETREDLVRRLLDPTLTLREAALLLDVCPTTVRRYTNRGLLSCFRTPGNQRRFRLSDILDFIEHREREEQ